jgi:sec-independent protein translocase protein TatA
MGGFSFWHILIFAIILLLLFGGNRFSNMMGDVAKGLKSFKQGMADDEDDKMRRYDEQRRQDPRPLPRNEDRPIDVTPEPRRTTDSVPPAGDDRTNG